MDLKQFDILLHDAEVKMKRLKALYEQWFQGVERIEPLIVRKDLERHLAMMRKERPRNTAARFRFQQLQARYNTYATYWGRIARQIEEGTYERDVRRARRRRGPVRDAPAEVKTFELDIDIDVEIDDGYSDFDKGFGDDEIADVLAGLEKRKSMAPRPATQPPQRTFSPFAGAKSTVPPPTDKGPATDVPNVAGSAFAKAPITATFGRPKAKPPPATSPRRPAPATHPASGARPKPPAKPPGDDGMKRLYDNYVAARARNNERTDTMSIDKLQRSVDKMKSKLRQKHGDSKKIDFEVVVQNGRVGLKPKIG